MLRYTAPDVILPSTGEDDPRIGHLLGNQLADGSVPRVVLVGFPSDEGVHRNGGRVGAAGAPDEIRRMLFRLTPDAERFEESVELLEHTLDLGNLELTDDVEQDQALLGEALAPLLAAGSFVIVLGGGHETSFGHFQAYAAGGERVSILNWDAHPDVRELQDGLGHAGSPFRQAILDPSGACRQFVAAGLLPHLVARSHLEFLAAHGGRFVWRRDLSPARIDEIYGALEGPSFVSFDLDAVEQAAAPGASSPTVGGLTADLWLHAAYRAGRTAAVRSCDIVEMNPVYDRDSAAARLAAATVWQVLKGLVERDL
ncbi:MAG TPA: formimidoylglutamase [Gemmatimonadales bacterium]|nr:formimidoylglutamase [Gemmatimonadales bacterium]